ncbi:AraC family transcriptional regulator [Sphingobacterium sp. BIGb0165]|uniref:helix-turn-helix domain-containing protein n=1 Tax=Sphingobacterium sp. BIGb0165 TaxID=2940615 RepID=UPI00216938D2|nr:helix-turn-helix domain-containing protein [Sphingobacterium sp. BIGb0165]MCS4226503.1 YesN/AraC family two-component response regulator [Sphingobacterium sp. BIGb0165]
MKFMEGNYNSLILILNITICVINVLLLVITYKQRQIKKEQKNILPLNPVIKENEEFDEIIPDKIEIEQAKKGEVLISKITADRLIEEFNKAQINKFFLKKGVSLGDLADLLNTNQRYASYIVNMVTGQDFNNYVQQARIAYLIERVERDPDLLNVKFSILAESAGFSSISKFSSVFKSVMGVPPSEYFQKK